MAETLRNILTKSQGERAVGRVASSYHRIPHVMFGETNIAMDTRISQLAETEYTNDTGFVFEVHGLGFEGVQFAVSPVTDTVHLRGIYVKDVMRDQEWTPVMNNEPIAGGNMFDPLAVLVDFGGNSQVNSVAWSGQDVLSWQGMRWQLRYPTLIPPTGRLLIRKWGSTSMRVAVYGALLIPSESEPFRGAAARLAASYLHRFIAPKEMEQLRQTGGYERQLDRQVLASNVIGYERVPYVLNSRLAMTSTDLSQQFPIADFTNQTQFDFHVQEVGMTCTELFSATPSVTWRNVGLKVVDGLRNQEWNKELQSVAALVALEGSQMRIGLGTTVHGTKWNLGPGTILPPGGFYEVTQQQYVAGDQTNQSVNVAMIGSLLVPVIRGTLFAECYEKFLRAVPVRY